MLPKGLLKEYSRLLALVLRGLDVSAIIIAGILAYFLKFDDFDLPDNYINALLISAILTPLIFGFFGIYASMRDKGFWYYLCNLIQGICGLLILLAGLAFLTKSGDHFSRGWFMWWGIFSACLLVLFRGSIFITLRIMRTHGWNERRVIILGSGELGARFAESVQQALWTGFRIVALFDDDAQPESATLAGIPILKPPRHLSEYIAAYSIDEVWLAYPFSAEEKVKKILHELRHQIITSIIAGYFWFELIELVYQQAGWFPRFECTFNPHGGWQPLDQSPGRPNFCRYYFIHHQSIIFNYSDSSQAEFAGAGFLSAKAHQLEWQRI